MGETDLFETVKKYLIHKYNCHTLILYGSYSRGDFTNESDLDIVGFTDFDDDRNEIEFFEGKQLDVWIYNTAKMNNPEHFMHVCNGKILLNENGFADKFLLEVKNLFNKGPKKLSKEEKEFLKTWLRKMNLRSNKKGIESNYRFHWLLKDSLEIYFSLKGLWFLGPKKAFDWLQENDEIAYKLFNQALAIDAKKSDIEELVGYLNGM